MALSKIERRQRIKNRIKKVVSGTIQRPRLAVFRSNNEIYAQIIDDTKGITLVAASSRDKEINTTSGTKTEKSKLVGELIAKKAIAAGIETISFDRGGYLYHGRVKALAEGAREAGLKF
ncbi:50S ribosomal protein L18 [Capnocytophaga catalasegens]|uniref:Large ribosomal subunit protein uL18 n=1 Tax=Capnocytophaga catalasegens TaxID=1004260 RepID=A0AAV5AZD5_9FLAO|nr:50S ribosomal protein L18 [Capnocytophaga catalasegens]GIZ14654.1 50S ribosomal protein L18 [Capnocytophaga catalasegens]GJM50856.1 50S ribosomal protein L18 [Capnocytophaga catalasegens]GJM52009.1 50S ribosomal protein L18 [Capnocytophaga catalasegens]